jgi:hypothetical protein
MKQAVYLQKVRHLEWLKGIAKDYAARIDFLGKAGQDLTIEAIGYTYHGPGTIQLNPHRSIDMAFIFAAFNDALRRLREEIAGLEEELKSVTVEL